MNHLHKKIYILVFYLIISYVSFSQNSQANDTANIPYWIDMMQDESVNFYDVQRAFNLYWEGREVTKGCGYKPFKRWEYMMQDNILLDGGRLPADYVMQEFQKFKSNQSSNYPLAPGSQPNNLNAPGYWTPLGPKYMPVNGTGQPNGLGRINGIAFHPTDSNIFYIGAPAGGLWKTIDQGKTWKTTTDTLVSLGVSDIAIHPINPEIVFIGTGDRDANDAAGIGVMKSTDGGDSWSFMNSGMGNRTVSKLVIHPTRPDTMLAATNAGIYLTHNGGQSWTRTSTSNNYKDLVFRPHDPSVLYATTGYKFYRSTNTGASWTQITSGLPTAGSRGGLAVSEVDSDYVYFIVTNSRTFKALYLSTDAGLNFSTQSTTPNIMDYSTDGSGTGGQAWYDMDIAVDPTNKSIVYVGGVNIFKSVDKGVTWDINAHWTGSGGAPAMHADQHCIEFDPINKYVFAGNDGGIYYSRNGGTDWQEITDGINISQIYKIGQSALEKNTVVNGYQDNGTSVYYGFDEWNTEIGGDGMECIADYSEADYLYGALYYGDIRRSSNHGLSFSRIAKSGTNGITESGAWVTPYILDEDSSSHMFVGYKNVWRSENIKESSASNVAWKKISDTLAGTNSSNIRVLEQSPANPQILYISRYDYKVFRTDSARGWNPVWIDISSSLPYNSAPTDIEAHPTLDSVVYMALYGRIYKSVDLGLNWVNISANLPVITYTCIVFDSSSNEGLYVGSRSGVYYKDASMSNWILYTDGLPLNANVNELEIYYDQSHPSRSKIRAATYGRGLWESSLYSSSVVKPTAAFISNDSMGCVDKILRFEDYSINHPTSVYWKFNPSTVTLLLETDSASFNPVVRFDSAASYSLDYIVSNSAGTDTFTKNNFINLFNPLTAATCTTSTTNSSGYGIGIYNVTLNNLDFSSAAFDGVNSYHDYSCEGMAIVEAGETYYMNVSVGSYNSEYVEAYIDYNQDGDFSDTGELIMSTGKYKNVHTDTIIIPSSPIISNTKLRMRVVSDFSAISNNACKTLSYGESEDYGLFINNIQAGFTFSDSIICENQYVIFNDTSVGISSSIAWDFGAGANPRYASGKGPHQIQFNSVGMKSVSLTLNSNISAQQNIYVNAYPQTSLAYSSDTVLCYGQPMDIRFRDALKMLNLNYQWYKNNTAISSKKDSILYFGSVNFSDSGSYYCLADNQGCMDTSESFSLRVNSLPQLSFMINDNDQCLSANLLDIQNSTSNASSYFWTFGDGNSSNSINPNHTYQAEGLYQIKLLATSSQSCTDSLSKSINIRPMPIAEFTINDVDQCLAQNHFSFINTSANAVAYQWDFDDGQKSNGVNTSHIYSMAGNYDVKLVVESNYACLDSITKPIDVREMPSVSFSVNDTNQCFNNNQFVFSNTSSLVQSSQWSFGDGSISALTNPTHSFADSGVFDVKLIGVTIDGCIDSVSTNLIVYRSPIVDFSLSDSQLCFAGNRLTITDYSDGDYSIVYFGDGDSSLSINPVKSYLSTGQYEIIVKSFTLEGCVESASKNVLVLETPKADFTSNPVCLGDSMFFVNTSSTADTSQIWSFDWQFASTINSTLMNPVILFQTAGSKSIQLVVGTFNQCSDTVVLSYEVYPLPPDSFSFMYLAEGELSFEPYADASHLFSWYFGDGDSSKLRSPSHIYPHNLDYQVELQISSTEDCFSTSTDSISISNKTSIDQAIEQDFQLQVYPNPFNQFVHISFILDQQEDVLITLYDAQGKRIQTVVHDQLLKGRHQFEINEKLAASHYLLKIEIGRKVINKQLIKK